MKIHVRDVVPCAWKVVNARTDEPIRDVLWADDDAGELLRLYRDQDGKLVVRYDDVMTEFLQGQTIRIEPVVLNGC